MSKVYIGLAGVVVAVSVMLYTLTYQQEHASTEDRQIFSQEDIKNAQILKDISIGDVNAPVHIYEYISLTCSHCASFHKNSFYKIKDEFIDTGIVKYTIREYPLDGIARTYSILARCAEENKFFNIYDALLNEQNKWIRTQEPLNTLEEYARKFGFDENRIQNCFENTELLENLYSNTDKANEILQINSTPTFFVNGEKIEGAPSLQEMRNIIQDKIKNENK